MLIIFSPHLHIHNYNPPSLQLALQRAIIRWIMMLENPVEIMQLCMSNPF